MSRNVRPWSGGEFVIMAYLGKCELHYGVSSSSDAEGMVYLETPAEESAEVDCLPIRDR